MELAEVAEKAKARAANLRARYAQEAHRVMTYGVTIAGGGLTGAIRGRWQTTKVFGAPASFLQAGATFVAGLFAGGNTGELIASAGAGGLAFEFGLFAMHKSAPKETDATAGRMGAGAQHQQLPAAGARVTRESIKQQYEALRG